MANNKPIPTTPYPIATYNDLKTAVAEYMDRDDTEFLNQIPNFIDFAQKGVFRDNRFNFSAKEAYIQVSNGLCNLPTDYLSMDYLIMGDGYREIRETSRAEVFNHQKLGLTMENTPEILYTRMQDRLLFSPTFDAALPVTNADGSTTYDENTVIMGYYYDPARPSQGGQNAVDYLIAIAPDALLYSACANAASFISDDDAEKTYTAKYNLVMNQLTEQNKTLSYQGVKRRKLANVRQYW